MPYEAIADRVPSLQHAAHHVCLQQNAILQCGSNAEPAVQCVLPWTVRTFWQGIQGYVGWACCTAKHDTLHVVSHTHSGTADQQSGPRGFC